MAFGDRAEGLVAVVRMPHRGLADIRLPRDRAARRVVEGVEKPGNLGAILRSADGGGARRGRSPPTRARTCSIPNVIRASLGTIFSRAVVAASSRRGPRLAAGEPGSGSWRRASTAAIDYADADLRGPVAIVLGSEADGLSRRRGAARTSRPSDSRCSGVADSLNVSAAAAVLLYEARRQRDGR